MLTAKKYTYFIGIDVSRNELDFAINSGQDFLFHREIPNTPSSITQLIEDIRLLPKFMMTRALFCMEATGIYCNHLLNCLKKYKADCVVENALHIKLSGGALRGKDDKIDSVRIANYASKNHRKLRLFTGKRPVVEQISELFTLRQRLISTKVLLKTPIEEQGGFVKKNLLIQNRNFCKNSIAAVETDLSQIDLEILKLINNDERLHKLFTIITSVPSIGTITVIQIIISTNEYRNFTNPKKFACYAGIAPFGNSSGKTKGKSKISQLANKKIKSLLHICAMGVIRYDKELKAYYERKTKGENKSKMAVLNAVRYKLVLRVFACLAQDRLYEKEYERK
ncbi:MAG: IS110 family transposase [Janthinobacterium lividum]